MFSTALMLFSFCTLSTAAPRPCLRCIALGMSYFFLSDAWTHVKEWNNSFSDMLLFSVVAVLDLISFFTYRLDLFSFSVFIFTLICQMKYFLFISTINRERKVCYHWKETFCYYSVNHFWKQKIINWLSYNNI